MVKRKSKNVEFNARRSKQEYEMKRGLSKI